MFSITTSQLDEMAEKGRYACLVTDVFSDVETPISLYHKLGAGEAYSFLLESAEQDARMGRYSFLGFDPIEVLTFEEDGDVDPLAVIEAKMEELKVVMTRDTGRFQAGFVGYFSYDGMRHFERLPVPELKSSSEVPEAVFVLPRVVIAFDHVQHVIQVHYLMDLEGDRALGLAEAERYVQNLLKKLQEPVVVPALTTGSLTKDEPLEIFPSRSDFLDQVAQAKSLIESGEIFQVVLSHSIQSVTNRSPFELYRALRRGNPSPYMYFFQYEDFAVVGASPETMVRLEGGEVLVRPIAGTRPRGGTAQEDQDLEVSLLGDLKERAEHMMLVDLGRNDVGRVSERGSVQVINQMAVQRFSSVMHLVSDVVGRVQEDRSMFDVFRACFPAGTLSGAPKIRAAQIIASLEGRRRGLYGGAVGYFDYSGSMDFAIAIRTMVYRNGTVYLQAGAGVVYDSIPQKEHEECLHKARSCLSVL